MSVTTIHLTCGFAASAVPLQRWRLRRSLRQPHHHHHHIDRCIRADLRRRQVQKRRDHATPPDTVADGFQTDSGDADHGRPLFITSMGASPFPSFRSLSFVPFTPTPFPFPVFAAKRPLLKHHLEHLLQRHPRLDLQLNRISVHFSPNRGASFEFESSAHKQDLARFTIEIIGLHEIEVDRY